MSSPENTQYQSSEELKQSQDLSLDERKPPADIEGYSLQSFLGSGAYGEVWAGIDRKTGRKVAVKFYTRKSSLDFTMLSREVEKLVFLAADRYVVQLLDVGWGESPPYYVMDYIENGSLEDELKRRTTIPVEEAIDLFEETGIGLMHLHGKGILHCDLKPGNVLLDQDKKPRLADFGQSRLSHEQAPALGTLFFMAPEQADMKAVPDARWDVYALGALLYCMLTGSPPYREDGLAKQLESSDSLDSRLKTYKRLIQASPKPTAHRQIPGVNKLLGDIISRCIHSDPKHRFSSVQSVLTALRQRKEVMTRRPLMVLGILGPLILLSLMSVFAWWAYSHAITESDFKFKERANASNMWAARFAARAVANRIDDYFDAVQNKSESTKFQNLYTLCLEDNEINTSALKFVDPSSNSDKSLDKDRKRYRENANRINLNELVKAWMTDKNSPKASSWFVCDKFGNQVAAEWDKPPDTNTIGQNWSYRSYFNMSSQDLKTIDENGNSTRVDRNLQPITGQKVSAVFLSKATNTWKVAFSVPFSIDDTFEGIIGMTVEMGEFIDFEIGDFQYAMLVNGRQGEHRGIVLEHPAIRARQKLLGENEQLPDSITKRRLDMSNLKEVKVKDAEGYLVDTDLKEPFGNDPDGLGDKQKWIAAFVPVKRTGHVDPESIVSDDTGLFLAAVSNSNYVTQPTRDLGRQMVRLGSLALLCFLIVTGGLAYLVVRSIRQSRRTVSKFYGGGTNTPSSSSSSLGDDGTLLAPDKSSTR